MKKLLANTATVLLVFLNGFTFSQGVQSLRPQKGGTVGDIQYNPFIDRVGFRTCHDRYFPQYYSIKGGYKGGKKRILIEFKNKHGKGDHVWGSGYVTIRFIVNCKGEIGRFRTLQIDKNYEPVLFNNLTIEKLYAFTRSLNDWRTPLNSGFKTDYYQYLTFVIDDGKVVDILP